MLYDAVVFDLDGTLTDSYEGIANCVVYALQKMGRPVPEEAALQKYMGPPLVYSFMHYDGMTEEEAVYAMQLYRELYVPSGWKQNRVYSGIRVLLKELHENGVHVCVATGKPQETSERILEYFGLMPYIDAVAGPTLQAKTADKTMLIMRALEGISYRKAVMVGDRSTDITGAAGYGIDSIAAGYGYGEREELESVKPTYYAQSVEELSRILLGYVPAQRGYFITMEGLDGCGKTTQMDAVEHALIQRGYDVRRSREPGGCAISEKIRDLLLDVRNGGMCDITEAILYAASRAQHVREVIRPALASGQVVLCDRFVDSSIAFQGGGRELGVELVQKINAPALDGCRPDTTVYLKLDHQTALNRRSAASTPDRIESEKESFHARVEAAYDLLVGQDPQRFVIADARKKPEEITQEILEALYLRMEKAGMA